MKWSIKRHKILPESISKDFSISIPMATVIANKNIYSKKEIYDFLIPDLKNLSEMENMKDAKDAVYEIIKGINQNKKFVIYGDYDADGITSTYILYSSLKKLNADVFYYIPDRHTEGYGLNKKAISKIKNKDVDILITCDNGIAAIEEIDYAKELGMTVIVTDHHEPRYAEKNGEKTDILPKADFIVDPKQKDCPYPFKEMCAAGISYRFVKLLYKKLNISFEDETDLIVFAGIATICDIVDLVSENRILAQNAIKNIKNTKNIGLNALIDILDLRTKDINEYHIGNIIGPCINATGRLEKGDIAVSLFTSTNEKEAFKIANYIKDLNTERKRLTEESFFMAVSEIKDKNFENENLIFFKSDKTPESIAGIVAGRLKEKYFKPSFVLTLSDNVYKCSSRSIEGYNIFDELLKFKNLFLKFGGHSMAAGFSITPSNLLLLEKGLKENCTLTKDDFIPSLRIEKLLSFEEIDLNLCEELNFLRPFGKANDEPLFATKNLSLKKISFLNKGALKFIFYDNLSDIALEGIMFNSYEKFKNLTKELYNDEKWSNIENGDTKGIFLDIVYTISINEFNGKRNIQLNIKDFRYSI